MRVFPLPKYIGILAGLTLGLGLFVPIILGLRYFNSTQSALLDPPTFEAFEIAGLGRDYPISFEGCVMHLAETYSGYCSNPDQETGIYYSIDLRDVSTVELRSIGDEAVIEFVPKYIFMRDAGLVGYDYTHELRKCDSEHDVSGRPKNLAIILDAIPSKTSMARIERALQACN